MQTTESFRLTKEQSI